MDTAFIVYCLFTLLHCTSYRYGLPVPVSSLHRDERLLSRQDGLLSCTLPGGLLSGIRRDLSLWWFYSHVHQHKLRLLRDSVAPKSRVLEFLRQNTWRVRMSTHHLPACLSGVSRTPG